MPRKIELKVHGLIKDGHGFIPARLFANKLKQLVGALEAADAIANGNVVHSYVLAQMHMSVPTAVLAEIPRAECDFPISSSIPVFAEAVESIKTGSARIEYLDKVVKKVGLLTTGVESTFGFAEVRPDQGEVIRIDKFLRDRTAQARRDITHKWYDGTAIGTFDGTLEYVDIRGSLPQIKLILTAGRKEIDCICKQEDIEILGGALSQRVRVHGRAIYSGTSPLPIRVEVLRFETIKSGADFTRWKGSFRPFSAASWDGDE